jgi:hypothetical protein
MQTTTMYIIVDDIDKDGRGIGGDNLCFSTREEAEMFKTPQQKILVRDGCPIKVAIELTNLSRILCNTKEKVD